MNSILFVCTANICRSPMAEGLFQKIVEDDANHWAISSAGTWANEGDQAAEGTLRALEKKGIDLHNHRSKMVTEEMLSAYNLILTMEKGQKEALKIEFPGISKRVFLLSEMVNQLFDISDPIGQPLARFEETMNDLDQILRQGKEKIEHLSGNKIGG